MFTQECIKEYLVPIARILIDFICAGTIVRCMLIGHQGMESNSSFSEITGKMKKRIWAAICAICIVEFLNFVARSYSFDGMLKI